MLGVRFPEIDDKNKVILFFYTYNWGRDVNYIEIPIYEKTKYSLEETTSAEKPFLLKSNRGGLSCLKARSVGRGGLPRGSPE